jgi:hypothetical protein
MTGAKRRRLWLAASGVLFVGLLAAGSAFVSRSDGGTEAHSGGLYGTVTRGPTTPVCQEGKPCSEPASGAKLLFDRGGHVAANVVVAKDGSYSVRLAPGKYTIVVEPRPTVGRGIDPSRVRVSSGPPRELDLQIDTGIR